MRTEFVDRVEHMAELRELAAGLFAGRGGALVLDSIAGMGKTSLLGAFSRLSAEDPGLRRLRLVGARCHPGIGPGLVYGPVVDLMLPLAKGVKQPGPVRQFLSFTRRGVVRTAPELLSAMVPGLGMAFTIGQEVTQASLATGSMPFDSLQPFQQGVALQIVEALVDLARSGDPILLTVDDVQHMDPSSMLVVDRLLHQLSDAPIGLVLSHTTDAVAGGGHAAMVEEMLQRWADDGVLTRRRLGGLPPDAVHELVRSTHPTAPAAYSEKLTRLTDGHAVFVRLCLDEWRPDAGDEVGLPPSLTRIVETRMGVLPAEDRELLAVAATQGPVFLSRVVASALGARDEDVMERLRRIAGTGLVELTSPPAWATEEESDCYRFQHGALWRVVYERQTPGQAWARHAAVARALTPERPDSGWHAYNAALLAQLLVRHPARGAEGVRLMEQAWAETERTWLANLVPIVRNLYAQILLEAAEPPADALERAGRLAVDTVLETRNSGMIRSEIAALSLRSRVLLAQGDRTEAEVSAREALRVLDEVGDMPALRTEEVLYRSAVVLRETGNHAEARPLLGRARAVIARKAGSIPDERLREGFLRNVPLNRAVLDAEWGER
ncbi:AAA family ATPase [Streptomyces cinereoruber]|uniref:AAA family ATPase n=1 Tax=Streptomyces cinereoruber TaxID=67260 RepID=UPI003650A01D